MPDLSRITWEAMAQVFVDCPRHVELGHAGIIVFETSA